MDQKILPFIELKGSPYERGKQHGEAYKDEIRALIEENYKSLIHFSRERAKIDFQKQQGQILSARYLPYMQEYAPDLVEEIRGIAYAANLPVQEILFLNCYLDIYDIVFPGLSQPLLFGCTTFAATKPATRDNSTIVAQNLDLRAFFNKFGILLKIVPDEGLNALVYTMAGVVGLAGINHHGLSLVFNKLVPRDSSYGVPYPFIARKVLQQSRIGQAIYSIGNPHRASGSYCLVGSADANIYGIECTSSEYRVFNADEGYLAHSNHYIHPALDEHNKFYLPYGGDTFVRINQANQVLKQNCGHIDMENVKQIGCNHSNYPDSICRHSDLKAKPFFRAETMASLIFLPNECRCWISSGSPCESKYISYSL